MGQLRAKDWEFKEYLVRLNDARTGNFLATGSPQSVLKPRSTSPTSLRAFLKASTGRLVFRHEKHETGSCILFVRCDVFSLKIMGPDCSGEDVWQAQVRKKRKPSIGQTLSGSENPETLKGDGTS